MFCTWCKDRCQDDSRYKCNFTEGCDNPKVDAIQKHETKNAYHKKLNMRSLPQKKKKKELVVLKLVGHRVCLMTRLKMKC